MIDEWIRFQKNWGYLENIFKAPDIGKAMPDETNKFNGVDKYFKTLMQRTQKMPKCIQIVKQHPQTLDMLKTNNQILDLI